MKAFLLLFISGGHLVKTVIRYFAIEVILIEPLDDAVQFGDALCGLLQFPAAFTELSVEVTLIFLGEQFRKFGFPFTNKGKHSIYLHQQNLLHLYIAYLVGGAFSFLLTIGGAGEMLLLVCPPSGSDLVQFRTAVGAEQHPG